MLDEKQIRLGLIGKSLNHSFSAKYFNLKFEVEQIKYATYQLYEIDEISFLPILIQTNQLNGLNVTIPFKQEVIPFCHSLTPIAQEVQAVNCILIHNDKIIGHNTDVYGFLDLLKSDPKPELRTSKALIFGSGGASLAVRYCLDRQKIDYQIVSTSGQINTIKYEDIDALLMQEVGYLINTTPIGMHPFEDVILPFDHALITANHFCIDLIYNPSKTLFLSISERQGASIANGLTMLEKQAELSWEFWTQH